MLLYWGMFTLGFWVGSILAFVLFASKDPVEEEKLAENYKLETLNWKQEPMREVITSSVSRNRPVDWQFQKRLQQTSQRSVH